jgi:hypothetical protein
MWQLVMNLHNKYRAYYFWSVNAALGAGICNWFALLAFLCNLGSLIPSKVYADTHPFNDETNQKIPDGRNSLSQ